MNAPLSCPKCRGAMFTHNRQGIHIEQCNQCRGIFLDYGELEAILQLQMQWQQQMMPPSGVQPPQPGWGAPQHAGYNPHYGHKKPYKKSFMGMLFSS